MEFTIAETNGNSTALRFEPKELIIAGWTGRDQAIVQAHIRELEELGVAAPATTPVFYRVAASRLTTAAKIQVTGTNTSGEVEIVLIRADGELFVGTGSDHTDRDAEAIGVTLSKQLCDKPWAKTIWRYADVESHWDDLRLVSRIGAGGETYQEGTAAEMLTPADLLSRYEAAHSGFADGMVMFCGTLPVIGGLRPSDRFVYELYDPKLERRIESAYETRLLPVAEAQ